MDLEVRRSNSQKTGAEIIDGDDAREIWKLNAGVELNRSDGSVESDCKLKVVDSTPKIPKPIITAFRICYKHSD